ncbi:MAG: sigma-54-dependent Fis family transcriptional regulator [Candidatus Marinimicrobia bacterium]|jgi:DNA-binding NtrC family response regulator|nr:sigma-54-dependent Fis family transcriptional regulator [Candidatus Neomarinimicrobiota bacterium]MBT3496765.1 sigma-54-dependent Fis family transcriptional regulator [Candidatus Neomarinimicrobiota bacterium]MBT3692214.1 sigma-54-dependent Fis family transcriptional regulator [Candidatus Neomarinimicrobiota bacterium]MBT3732405.1 sigma-54-dependent Fis family transcriptional regulator [Candidatus Neomarinimicrobiota bacterium]MBT4145254.1 sigma-54-dependent Fis family transcriptional regula
MDIDRIQKLSGIIGHSDKIREVLDLVAQVAPVDITALITGESGVGKEMVAKAVHLASRRSREELVVVNCGAIPEGIIESELFGHKKGAFTGAENDRKGYFEFANKGTIFLDEIGETPLSTQVKLLRVLETGEFMRVGDSKTLKTDVRVIAATNKNLGEMVQKGTFRQDLYYRLKTVTLHVPSLRDRVEDISHLVERFALEFTQSNEILYRGFMPEAIRLMKKYEWPGNVRELKNFVEKILVLEKGERITEAMISRELADSIGPLSMNPNLPVLVNDSAERAEIDLILRQLFLLRQDSETIRNQLMALVQNGDLSSNTLAVGDGLNIGRPIPDKSMEITDDDAYFIRDEAIGDMVMKDLEREAITRTLKFFNNNRRKSAKSLNMSERTLYRKIEEFGLEPKIKKSHVF